MFVFNRKSELFVGNTKKKVHRPWWRSREWDDKRGRPLPTINHEKRTGSLWGRLVMQNWAWEDVESQKQCWRWRWWRLDENRKGRDADKTRTTAGTTIRDPSCGIQHSWMLLRHYGWLLLCLHAQEETRQLLRLHWNHHHGWCFSALAIVVLSGGMRKHEHSWLRLC